MSKKSIFSASLAQKYWMALTGLFLITFLIGHLLGNLQLIFKTGEEGRRAFNEYAYFMGHNIFIKLLAYATYFAILFHAFKGFWLTYKNKKARPQKYAYERPSTNSGLPSRYMAILGTLILVFICTHMANFWWKQKITEEVPLHTISKTMDYPAGQNPMTGQMMTVKVNAEYILTTKGEYIQKSLEYEGQKEEVLKIKDKTLLIEKQTGLQKAEAYKDLHTVVMDFFSNKNELVILALLLYTFSMAAMAFHLWHGFASAFQTLGWNHPRYNGLITLTGKLFAIGVSTAFAIIPIIIYLRS